MRKIVLPHPVLLIEGQFLALAAIFSSLFLLGNMLLNFKNASLIEIVLPPAFAILIIYFCVFLVPQCFGIIMITNTHIIYFGLFLPIIRIKIEDIRFCEIRTFDKGNVMYSPNNPIVDAYKFMLLSTSPLPTKRIDKIFSSRRKKIIKFAVSYKLCSLLKEVLPKEIIRDVEYQLFLYRKAGVKKKK